MDDDATFGTAICDGAFSHGILSLRQHPDNCDGHLNHISPAYAQSSSLSEEIQIHSDVSSDLPLIKPRALYIRPWITMRQAELGDLWSKNKRRKIGEGVAQGDSDGDGDGEGEGGASPSAPRPLMPPSPLMQPPEMPRVLTRAGWYDLGEVRAGGSIDWIGRSRRRDIMPIQTTPTT